MDSVQKPPARRAGELLVSLIDSVSDLPEFADIALRMHWQVTPLGAVNGSLYDVGTESPLDILVRWQEQFGGVVSPSRETWGSGAKWHNLETILDGVDVVLRVPVPVASVEDRLREENAALKAALQAAVDAPVPFEIVEDGGPK